MSQVMSRHKTIKSIIFWSIVAGFMIALLIPITSLAAPQPIDPCNPGGSAGTNLCVGGLDDIDTASPETAISDFIIRVSYVLVYIAGAVTILFIIIGGYLALTSAGNENQYKSGLQTLTRAIIGLVIVIASFGLVSLLSSILANFSF